MKNLFAKKEKNIGLTIGQVREMRLRIERVFDSLFNMEIETKDFIKIMTQIQGVELMLEDLEKELA